MPPLELPTAIEVLLTVTLGVVGLIIGSFLNVVILRLPKDESIVFPGSHCPKCNRELSWYENIPVLSWLALRAKCRTCKAPISGRYAIIELLTGCLYLAALARFGFSWQLLAALAFISFTIPVVFIDAEHWIIPLEITFIGIAAGILLQLPLGLNAVVTSLIGATAAFVGLRVLEFFGWLATKQEALGGGDKYLYAMLGAFVGWRPLLGILLLASVQGAIWGIARIALTGRAAPEKNPEGADDASKAAGENPTREPAAPGVAEPGSELPGLPRAVEAPPAPAAPPLGAVAASASQPAPGGEPLPPAASAPPLAASPPAPDLPTDPTASPAVGASVPPGETAAPAEDPFDGPQPWTPDVFKPGLPFWRRLVIELPWTVFIQPIPDDPPLPEGAPEGAEPEWTPGVTNLPFGPWLGLAALEILLLGDFVTARLGHDLFSAMVRMVFQS